MEDFEDKRWNWQIGGMEVELVGPVLNKILILNSSNNIDIQMNEDRVM